MMEFVPFQHEAAPVSFCPMDVEACRPAVSRLPESVDLIWSSREKPLVQGGPSKTIVVSLANNQGRPISRLPEAVILIWESDRLTKNLKERSEEWDSYRV